MDNRHIVIVKIPSLDYSIPISTSKLVAQGDIVIGITIEGSVKVLKNRFMDTIETRGIITRHYEDIINVANN